VLNENSLPFSPYHHHTWSTYLDYRFIYFVAICAFFINLSREIIKDIRDIPGDSIINAPTIPRQIGSRKATLLSLLILQMPALFYLILKLISDFALPSRYTSVLLLTLELLFLAGLIAYFIAPTFLDRWLRLLPNLALLLGLTCLFF
jgi:4-hydroxybenzoate polyprenyltransferase